MFEFKADIIQRRKINKAAVFTGTLAGVFLGLGLGLWLKNGSIPFIEEFLRQLGFFSFVNWFYAGLLIFLLLFVWRALSSLLMKKKKVGGQVSFDEHNLKIQRGKDKFVIPEAELEEIEFELRPLKRKGNLMEGGHWMKIPTQNGIFTCELDINNEYQKKKLLDLVEFLKIEHDVKVNIKELE